MPPKKIQPLSADEERQLRALEERRAAAQAYIDSARDERRKTVKTLDDLYTYVDELVAERVRASTSSTVESLELPLEKILPSLVERIDGLTEDVNRLGQKERDIAGGGIGYDHEAESNASDPNDPKSKKFRLTHAVFGHLCGWQGPAAKFREREMLAEYGKQFGDLRSMQWGVSSSGGFMVAPQWMDGIIESLRPNLVLNTLGASFRPLTGPTSFRKWGSGVTSTWTAEGKKAVASQPTVARINLAPKPLNTLVKLSDDLLDMGPDALRGDVEGQMGRSQAETLDLAAFKGQGGEGEPLGIIQLAGGTTDWGIGGPGGDQEYGAGGMQNITIKLDDMVYQILARDVRGTVGFALGPLMLQKIRTTRDTAGHHIFFDQQMGSSSTSLSDSVEAGRLFGRPYAATSLLTSGTADDDIIAAVYSNVIVANFGPALVLPSQHASEPETGDSAFTQAETWIRWRQKWDIGLTYPEAVQVAIGADGAP